MENPHVACLSNLFDEYHLVSGLSNDNKKNVLVVVDKSLAIENLEQMTEFFSKSVNVKFTYDTSLDKETKTPLYDAILSGVIGNSVPCDLDLFATYIQLLTSGGQLIVKTELGSEEKLKKRFKICGFLNVTSKTSGIVIGNKHAYIVGSSEKVTLNSNAKESVISAWKLDDNNSETISEDDLLEADDLKKPESSSLKVCATTKKAKACKNCSCGLAEELEANRLKDVPKPPDTSNAKSSCGSCYLGDAFRCASCPYLGMPAFKPGEKVQLAGNLLQDDY